MTVAKRLRNYATYIRMSLHLSMSAAEQLKRIPSVTNWLLAAPVGLAAYVRDRQILRQRGLG